MAGRQRAPGKKVRDDSFSLDTVLKLGGSKDDFELLCDVGGDDAEAVDADDHDYDAEPIKKDELKSFIASLGFAQSSAEDKDKKPKKVKLLAAPGFDEKPSVDDAGPVGEGKKKQKNKFKTQVDGSNSDRGSAASAVTAAAAAGAAVTASAAERASGSGAAAAAAAAAAIVETAKLYKARTYVLLKPNSWEEQVTASGDSGLPAKTVPPAATAAVKAFAKQLLEDDSKVCAEAKEKQRQSDALWIKRVLQSGTSADRTAALVTLVHGDPPHNVSALLALVAMMKKKGRRESMAAIDPLKELFLGMLPTNRRLRGFEQNAFDQLDTLTGGNKDTRDRYLMLWYFECRLKELYAEYVQALQVLTHDVVLATKRKALMVMYELLADKPELEKVLLSSLVNKLGDPDRKMASKACRLLSLLVERHPRMKAVVTTEIEGMLFRPNIQQKSQYYGICFLNQLVLHQAEDKQLAARMIRLYFTFFKASVKQGEIDNKMMSALLTGINRAFPYARGVLGSDTMQEQIDTMYKVLHTVAFGTGVQVLMLLYQVASTSDSMSDRYYTALYRAMLAPELETSSKKAMFLNLIYKSMKRDLAEKRVKAFVKRLLQMALLLSPPFVCAALVLISEIIKEKPSVVCRKIIAPQSSLDGSKWGSDGDHDDDDDDDDEEEHFRDVVDADDDGHDTDKEADEVESHVDEKHGSEVIEDAATAACNRGSSWVHRHNIDSKHADKSDYDPHCRNPLYARAEVACEWELLALSRHYHPSVALFAQRLVEGQPISYDSDPLQDFQFIRFLDRFVYKNPKKKAAGQESAPSALQSRKQRYAPVGLKSMPVSSDEFLAAAEADVPVDDRFFHRYFVKKSAKKKSVEDEVDSEAGSVSDSEFDDFLDTHEKGVDGGGEIDFGADFASEFKKSQHKGADKKGDISDGSDDDDLDLSDEEPDFGDEDFSFDELDEDDGDAAAEEELEPDAEHSQNSEDELDDADEWQSTAPGAKKSKKSDKKGGKSGADMAGLFASAEAFSSLLDEEAAGADGGSLHAMANRDKASTKQLKWEADRDRWLRDDHGGHRKGQKRKGKSSHPASKSAHAKKAKRQKRK